MSSKFSRMAVAQKPPRACRRPPEGPQYLPPSWPEAPFQGFVDFAKPYSGWDAEFVSPLDMQPNAPARTWTGYASNPPGSLILEMYWYEPLNYLNFDVAIFNSGVPVEQWAMTQITPRAWSPFDTGLLWPDPQPFLGRLHFRILA